MFFHPALKTDFVTTKKKKSFFYIYRYIWMNFLVHPNRQLISGPRSLAFILTCFRSSSSSAGHFLTLQLDHSFIFSPSILCIRRLILSTRLLLFDLQPLEISSCVSVCVSVCLWLTSPKHANRTLCLAIFPNNSILRGTIPPSPALTNQYTLLHVYLCSDALDTRFSLTQPTSYDCNDCICLSVHREETRPSKWYVFHCFLSIASEMHRTDDVGTRVRPITNQPAYTLKTVF